MFKENTMVIMDELCEMDCNVLKRLVRDDSGKCLVLDCRSFLAHSAGHIRGSVNIRCNTIVRRRAKGTVSLDQILSGDEEVRSRLKSGLYSAVILYDERTSHMDSIKEDSTITLVLNALYRDSYGTEIYLLKGKCLRMSSSCFAVRYSQAYNTVIKSVKKEKRYYLCYKTACTIGRDTFTPFIKQRIFNTHCNAWRCITYVFKS